MSTAPKSEAVVVPTGKDGAPAKAEAASVQKMAGGGLVLSPLPLTGGKRKTRKVSKKVKAMLKKMTPKQLKKMMKGGEAMTEQGEGEQEGARRKSRRGSRKTRARKYF